MDDMLMRERECERESNAFGDARGALRGNPVIFAVCAVRSWAVAAIVVLGTAVAASPAVPSSEV